VKRRWLIVVLLLGALAGRAAAYLSYDSFVSPVNSDYYAGAWRSPYNSFSTGASDVTLSDVWLRLELTGDPAGTAVVGLYQDADGAPGTLYATLATINDSDIVAYPSWQEFHITPDSVLLSANTRYWVGLTTSDQGNIAWTAPMLETLDGTTGVNGEYHGQGAWNDFSPNGPGESSPYQMRVAVQTQVPEPSSLALVGIGLGMLVLRRRRTSAK
jgi:hypothetical protein